MTQGKFERLVSRRIITQRELDEAIDETKASGRCPEELLIERGIPKHELLFSLSEHYGCPFVEYDERKAASYLLILSKRLDMERHKKALWFPLSVQDGRAEVVAYDPGDPGVARDIQRTLDVTEVAFSIALPSDIIRTIENSFDVNPRFPASAGRTPLAKVRTLLADRRSMLACQRTSLAKGRTGLAFLRTGISFISIAIVLFRVFGIGWLTPLEAFLCIAGILMALDGIRWYLPVRKAGRRGLDCSATESTWGTTALEASNPGDNTVFARTNIVEDADNLRADWKSLSPVMRRRFLAGDRTDMAEERTVLACYRTAMASARTGLAFVRTGTAFTGLGIALFRQFRTGPWTFFDIFLILTGSLMLMEGVHWYLPGRRAGVDGLASVRKANKAMSIWDFVLPQAFKQGEPGYPSIPVMPSYAPGIWATTGLALERTVLADRRNVMARLRTVMARSRTGMAFIRTGMGISAVGAGLLVSFGSGSTAWTLFDAVLILAGLALIIDGLYWYLPAEKTRRHFPYCFGEMEITVPDYGVPARRWRKAVFSHDES